MGESAAVTGVQIPSPRYRQSRRLLGLLLALLLASPSVRLATAVAQPGKTPAVALPPAGKTAQPTSVAPKIATPTARPIAGSRIKVASPGATASSVQKTSETKETTAAPQLPPPSKGLLEIHRAKLRNGLRVVMAPDPRAPTVSVCVTYDVGSRDEGPGQKGFAHLFEHMMFQGSLNLPKGDHSKLIAQRGGDDNGSTSSDLTNYYSTLPSSELRLGLWLEAERMKSLAVTRAKFENQRAVVSEEYREDVSNEAFGFGYLRLQELVFQGYDPYEHTPIGTMGDLDTAKVSWVKEFHRAYYTPNNAVLSIAGDFDPATTLAIVTDYFDDAVPGARPKYSPPLLIPQSSERLSVIEDYNTKAPGVYYGWRIPPSGKKHHTALQLQAAILGDGESSRLFQSLVRAKAKALNVSAWTEDHRGPDAFVIQIEIAPLSSIDKAQFFLAGELKRARLMGPSDAELAKAKARLRLQLLEEMESNEARATLLGEYEIFYGDARRLNERLAAIDTVTQEQVRAAAYIYLQPELRSVVEVYPEGWTVDPPPAFLSQVHIVRKGGNLIRIAKRYGSTVAAIAGKNGINPKRPIYPGQKLIIPIGARGQKPHPRIHTVKRGDNLIRIARKYGTTARAIAKTNGISTKRSIHPGQKLIIPPPEKKKRKKKRKKSKAESKKRKQTKASKLKRRKKSVKKSSKKRRSSKKALKTGKKSSSKKTQPKKSSKK
ncbi:MAG: LysM peptidoglycan-binding domain-containing protein [Polyangiaceae bacterium]|nr:LysM peptidoglycan-binding domain-containing protein [Polyangiaceae bacterium]